MQLPAILFALLPALVVAKECVSSGTAQQVDASYYCCLGSSGKWCATTEYQGICVVPDAKLNGYVACTDYWGNPTNVSADCIPGDGSELTACAAIYPSSTTSSARETITG